MPPRRTRRAIRKPGRPASDASPETREALLEAASRLFARHGAGEVSLRSLAEEAGVTPAMVHYYFGGKEGLYDAMLQRVFSRIVAGASALAVRGEAPRVNAGDAVDDLLQLLTDTFLAEPWLPALVVREVLSESGRFREHFIRDYASRMADLMPGLMRAEIAAGRFREDLDPRLAFLSFMGMAVFPFVARPVVERALGIEYDADFMRRFVVHTRRLFVEGAGT